MKLKDKQKLRQETKVKLQAEIERLEKEKTQKRLYAKIGREKNVHASRAITHTIAVIKTILREKELMPSSQTSSETSPSKPKKGKKE